MEKGTLGFMCHYNVQELEDTLKSVIFKLNNDHRLTVEKKNRILGTIVWTKI